MQTTAKQFQKKIVAFYKVQGRKDLPWRHTTDRYAIMVSEIMLQQTQVDRVIPKFEAWLRQFPTVQALAKAPLAAVLKAWSGLGYNNRAKRLQDAAKIILAEHEGQVPVTVDALIALPGIGPYTARSILIFADNADLATVDTNIRRIFIHEFGLPENTNDRELFALAQELLPKGKSRDWHNALMDYGALSLTSRATGIRPKTTQSRFAGSKRWYRGRIIKLLTEKTKISMTSLRKQFDDCEHDFDAIIAGLVDEGLIQEKDGQVSLR